MGWFGRKRDAPDASEMLRAYNEAEAARLNGLAAGSASSTLPPSTLSTSGVIMGDGELIVEDVFTITGRGLVVTGKVNVGRLRVGDAVAVVRGASEIASTEITGIEMFRKRADEAVIGDMVGLLLRGTVDVARGDVIRVATSA
ncbi:hypothetical protein CQ045_01975 [Microbacterium sp. MYb66]|jgi:translation elongation factor EF-Tu-like GTPase|nr:EF-Tu/IF-2/RF-3 family GTPase [Microbacterium sp. MYb66]PRA83183.1 hypothetical protein CQ045_01975 [Microbacterium sp. MYb66]